MSASKRHDYNFRAFLQRVVGLINVYLLLSLPPRLFRRIIWETLRIEPEALIDLIAGTERRPDFIVSMEVLNEDGTRMRIYILIEHKSHPDHKVALQVASYEIRLLEKTRAPVYSVVVFTGNKAFPIPTVWESALGKKADKIAPFPQHNHRPRVMMLKDIADLKILKHQLGIFVYVAKHIDDFHDDDKVITVLKYCHRLLRDDLELEVTWLLGYMISTKGNGVDRRRLTAVEEREFANISKEDRIMQRYAFVTDIAEDRGRTEGHAEGKAEGKAEVAIRMLEEGISIEVISRITGLKRSELNKLKRA